MVLSSVSFSPLTLATTIFLSVFQSGIVSIRSTCFLRLRQTYPQTAAS
jgi:hypothetical protein